MFVYNFLLGLLKLLKKHTWIVFFREFLFYIFSKHDVLDILLYTNFLIFLFKCPLNFIKQYNHSLICQWYHVSLIWKLQCLMKYTVKRVPSSI